MTSKMKILVPLGILIILGAVFSISKWSSEKRTSRTDTQDGTQMESTQAPEPTGNVDDLFMAIDASAADEDMYVTPEVDQVPVEGGEYNQSLNYEI